MAVTLGPSQISCGLIQRGKQGAMPCPPCHFEPILTLGPAVWRPSMLETHPKPGDSCRLLRSMTVPAAARQLGWAASRFRSSVTGSRSSTPTVLINRKAPGKPLKLTAEQLAALAAIVESGPIPASHGVVRWRIIDLCQWIWDEFRVSVSEDTVSRQLRAMGYRKLSARPRHHAQAQGAMEDFKKVSRGSWRKSRSKRTSPPA